MNKRIQILSLLVFLVCGLVIGFLTQFPDNRLHIVMCDVGQGDAIYIRTPNRQDVIIDGGPTSRVVECLGRHMPFWDRTLEIMVMTHPQADHMNGLINIIDRYSVLHFVTSPVGHTTKGFASLKQKVIENNIPVKNVYTGDKIHLGGVTFNTLWPDREWLVNSEQFPSGVLRASAVSSKTEENVLGSFVTKQDLNDFSVYLHLQYGTFDALFTGDGDVRMQHELTQQGIALPDVEVLKVPHHGSKTGMTEEFLDAVKPELALISVGKNSYGHPTQFILDLLQSHNIKTLRTDQNGDVEIVSDGVSWWVEK